MGTDRILNDLEESMFKKVRLTYIILSVTAFVAFVAGAVLSNLGRTDIGIMGMLFMLCIFVVGVGYSVDLLVLELAGLKMWLKHGKKK